MLKRLMAFALMAILSVGVLPAAAQDTTGGRSARAEIRFLEGMVDHHQMALDMANDCLSKDISDDLKTLCQGVIDAQTPEIEQMEKWLADWYQIDYQSAPMEAHDAHDTMSGMDMGNATDPAGMMGMMAGFDRYEGAEYEAAWLESMIDHHDDAVHMSERVLKWATHPELSDLANAIIHDQTAQIADMETMLTALGNS